MADKEDWNRAAYDAIEATLREPPIGYEGPWWFLKPNNDHFRAADTIQAWRAFVGRVKAKYEADPRVSPHKTAPSSHFDRESNLILGALRNAIVAKTV